MMQQLQPWPAPGVLPAARLLAASQQAAARPLPLPPLLSLLPLQKLPQAAGLASTPLQAL